MATPHEEGSTTRGRGRPRREETDAAAASWNDEVVPMLFELRYNTMVARFDGAKTSKQVNEAWSLLASQVCVCRAKVLTATQWNAEHPAALDGCS
ncbi:hypothetical protein PI124_g17616 [Phytophthora idaei]|nr:hypothetical protein PI125_g15176 [Phytophthora idaei]KAG3237395.1 hypothetical protein PI124_g17616 [Phytophthora idaei]